MLTKYSIPTIKRKILECLRGSLLSKRLGNYAFKAWYYYMEGKGLNLKIKSKKELISILEDISAQWELIEVNTAKFPAEYLRDWYKKLNELK